MDLKNHPKFKDRVAKLERASKVKLLKVPLITKVFGYAAYIVAVSANSVYAVACPHVDVDRPKFTGFSAWWITKESPYYEQITAEFVSWLLVSSDDDVVYVNTKDLSELAAEGCVKLVGLDLVTKAGRHFEQCNVQDLVIENKVKNPFHR
jgi:hypothetical protein